MGNQIGNIMLGSPLKQERMMAALRLMEKVFVSQLLTLAIEGGFIGYYIINAYLIIKKQFEEEEIISPLCNTCKSDNFQLICKPCRKILSCQGCFRVNKLVCPYCKSSLRNEDLIKIYMN